MVEGSLYEVLVDAYYRARQGVTKGLRGLGQEFRTLGFGV